MNSLKYIESKIFKKDSLYRQLNIWRFQTKKIVFTNGCFDVIHQGHIHFLMKAADMGSVLVVGLNSDSSVKRLKGTERPLQNENTRSLIMASFSMIDAVILFDEDTPFELIKFVKPNVLVKGGDYQIDQIVGADIVKSYGGEVKTVEFLEGFSSSLLIDNLRET